MDRGRVAGLFGVAETAREWFRPHSRYLGRFTPEEALKAGRRDRVRADFDGLAADVHGQPGARVTRRIGCQAANR